MLYIPYIKKTLRVLLYFIAALALYGFLAFALPYISVNKDFVQESSGVEVFIISNGVHTDIAFPVREMKEQWDRLINMEDFQGNPGSFRFISLGWGDKGFYLNTPTWADLKFSTAFNAAFLPSSTAMHVTMYDFTPSVGEYVRKVMVNREVFEKLQNLIIDSFQIEEGKAVYIPGYRYPEINDNFYEARGNYSLFKTCNGWTNGVLKNAGIKTAIWSPFPGGILRHFPY